jgi:hypothetical protein
VDVGKHSSGLAPVDITIRSPILTYSYLAMLRKSPSQSTPPSTFEDKWVYYGPPEHAVVGYEVGEVLDRLKRVANAHIGARLAKLRLDKHPAAADLAANQSWPNHQLRQRVIDFAKAVEALDQFELTELPLIEGKSSNVS